MQNKDISKESLKRKLRFTEVVYKIARSFVNLDDIDKKINNALEELGKAVQGGRTYLFLFNEDETMDNTHEWCNTGVEPQIDSLKGLPISIFPWWIQKLRNNEVINISDVSEMTKEAKAEKNILEAQDIKSILVLTVNIEKKLVGFIGIDNVSNNSRWKDITLKYLKTAAEMVGLNLLKKRHEDKIQSQKDRLLKSNKKLKQTQTQLVYSEKLAAIGNLAAGIAHEINNPIGYISGNMRALKNYQNNIKKILSIYKNNLDGKSLEKKETELNIDFILDDIEDLITENIQGVNKISKIVNNLRNFSRIDYSKRYEWNNISEGIKDTVAILNSKIDHKIKLIEDYNSVDLIYCDISLLNQVFLNIIVNALDALVESENEEKILRIVTKDQGKYVVCKFKDNGPGIPKNIKRKIFDPFFTTKPVNKGTGLGLNIAYDIVVNKHNGEIICNTEPDKGTEFILKFPKNKQDYNL